VFPAFDRMALFVVSHLYFKCKFTLLFHILLSQLKAIYGCE